MAEPGQQPTFDEFVDQEVDRALGPYLHLLPEADAEEFRSVLREELLAHPVSRRLLTQVRPEPSGVNKSGEVEKETQQPVAPNNVLRPEWGKKK